MKELKNNKIIKKKDNRGFTLVETLVAIAIFSIGTVAAVSAISQSLKLSYRIENKTIAAHLAQEGIELVRNIRDTNWMNQDDWDISLQSGIGCVQYNSLIFDTNCFGASNVLKFDGTYYTHDTGTDTIFTRTITITGFDDNFDGKNERMLINSVVTCGGTCTVTLQEDLYDWK